MSYFAHRIAQALGRSAIYCERVRVAGSSTTSGSWASRQHLLKDSKLTDEEYDSIKHHPENGMRILSGITFFRDIAPIVEGPHDATDGTAIPRASQGRENPRGSAYHRRGGCLRAMTPAARYRAVCVSITVAQLKEAAANQFDGNIVDVFLDILSIMTASTRA